MWAKCNIGASQPYEYGFYYAWGEIATKESYATDWSNYKFGSKDNFTKYTGSDGKSTLDPADDVAYMTYGANYSIPTTEDWQELKDNCYWEWTTDYSGKAGYIVYKNKGSDAGTVVLAQSTPNANYSTDSDTHIFLPAAGKWEWKNLSNEGTSGGYWSSTLSMAGPVDAHYVYIDAGDVGGYGYNRCFGFSIRPVSE